MTKSVATLAFNPTEMVKDLCAYREAARNFLEKTAGKRLDDLARRLESCCAAGMKDPEARRFSWGTGTTEPQPLTTEPSVVYKGAVQGAPHKPLQASVSFEWVCTLVPDGGTVTVDEGFVEVRLHAPGEMESAKVLHYDVCLGGFAASAAHPPMHVQFHGSHNDVPRLPTFFVHPVDVLDFILFDLFQKKWRDSVATTQVRAKLRRFPSFQRGRFAEYLGLYAALVRTSTAPPVQCFHQPLRYPLQLHGAASVAVS